MKRLFNLGAFEKNVLVLLSGSAMGQAIIVMSSPLLTRLYSPEEFGIYGLLLALLAVISEVAAGKYDIAIILPPVREDAFNLLILSCGVVLVVSSATLLVVGCLGTQIAGWLKTPTLAAWLWFLPLFVCLTGWFNSLIYWNSREKAFRRTASAQVVRSGVSAACNIGFPLAGFHRGGLIIGALIGQAITTATMAKKISQNGVDLRSSVSSQSLRRIASRYSEFPKYAVPSGLVESASGQIPSMVLSALFGVATLGFFSLAARVVNIPMTLIGNSIRDVFRQTASDEYSRNGHCEDVFNNTFKKLVALGIGPFIVMILFAPWVFSLVFGDRWKVSGDYVQLMSVMFFLRFISSPLSSMFIVAQRQRLDMLIQVSLFIATVGSLIGASHFTTDPKTGILIFASIYSLKYIIELWLSFRFSRGNRNGFGEDFRPLTSN